MNTQEKKDFLISQGWSFTEKAHNIDGLHAWVSPDASHKIHNSGIKIVTDQAYSFVSGEYIKKTETERKTQDILIAEMTRKIVALQEENVKQGFALKGMERLELQVKAGDIAQRELYEISKIAAENKFYSTDKGIVEYVRDAFAAKDKRIAELEGGINLALSELAPFADDASPHYTLEILAAIAFLKNAIHE